VSEVAVACGFGSPAHFSRSYVEWAGRAPSAERQAETGTVIAGFR
jgi:transcriptional regulator GlxA family with amidase domain